MPYTRTARVLHWLTASLLLGSFGLGISMTRWVSEDQMVRVFSWHEWIGVTVFGLTIVRLLWRLAHRPPPIELPMLERIGSQVVHAGFYVVLLVQPVVGWVMSTAFGFPVVYLGIVPLPEPVQADSELARQLQGVHVGLAALLLALFIAHLGGVLFHHLVRRDEVLHRMLPGATRRP
jgi:cytochrome b561